jgi:hypothetical protein
MFYLLKRSSNKSSLCQQSITFFSFSYRFQLMFRRHFLIRSFYVIKSKLFQKKKHFVFSSEVYPITRSVKSPHIKFVSYLKKLLGSGLPRNIDLMASRKRKSRKERINKQLYFISLQLHFLGGRGIF